MLYDMLDLGESLGGLPFPLFLYHEFRHLRVLSVFWGGNKGMIEGNPKSRVKYSTILLLGGDFKDFLFRFNSVGWNGNGMEKKKKIVYVYPYLGK